MTIPSVRNAIRTALHDEWWRSIHEKIEASPDGHVDRLTEAIMQALEPTGTQPPERILVELTGGRAPMPWTRLVEVDGTEEVISDVYGRSMRIRLSTPTGRTSCT